MMKWILLGVAVLAATMVIVTLIGTQLPQKHTASKEGFLPVAPDVLWPALLELGDRSIALATVSEDRPRRLVVRIADDSLPFGGRWTYDLSPEGSGTRLRITEDGEVYNPFFRFMSRYVFGHEATMTSYFAAAERRFGTKH